MKLHDKIIGTFIIDESKVIVAITGRHADRNKKNAMKCALNGHLIAFYFKLSIFSHREKEFCIKRKVTTRRCISGNIFLNYMKEFYRSTI